MAKKLGRPPVPHPRRHGVFVRFSDTERGALEEALRRDHAVAGRRPSLPEWIRDLVVAHASEILGVEVTRSALRATAGGAPDWQRWKISRAVRRAAPRRRRRSSRRPLPRRPKDAPWREGALRYASRCPLAAPPCNNR